MYGLGRLWRRSGVELRQLLNHPGVFRGSNLENSTMKKLLVLASLLTALLAGQADAGITISGGNVVVMRVGAGSTALTNASTAMFLEERSGSTGSLVQTFAFDTTGANRLTMSGTATSEGKIKWYNGNLAVTGYDSNAGVAAINGTTSISVNRSIAVINTDTAAMTFTRLNDAYSANNIRGAISDGTNIWTSGTATGASSGVRHATVGATTSTQLSTTATNIRTVNIADGQLFASHNSGASNRIMQVGVGLPTTAGNTMTGLAGIPNNTSNYDFFLADLDNAVAGSDTLFTTRGNFIDKYSLVSGTWNLNGSIDLGAETFGLSGIEQGGSVRFFANTAGFVRGYDLTSAWNTSFTATQLWTVNAGSNTAFRGVAAVPEPSSMALLGLVGLGGFAFRRFRTKKAQGTQTL